MTERNLLPRRHGRTSRSGTPAGVGNPQTVPTVLPTVPETTGEPTLFGLPAEDPDDVGPGEPEAGGPELAVGSLVVLRRPDAVAGSLLLVAATAGGLSLFLPWAGHGNALGLWLVQRGLQLAAGEGVGQLPGSGLLLPLVVALGGGVLFVAGLLAFVPAHMHRAVGVVALLVSLAVAAGVVVRLADADGNAVLTDPGILCAVVLAGAALLGALKAMLTPGEIAADET